MESLICYGELKDVVPVFIMMVESVDRSGNGEGDVLIVSYQYRSGRVISERVADGPYHFGVQHDIRKFWGKEIQGIVV